MVWEQSQTDEYLGDLDLDTNDYNNGMTIFYCSFLFAELPSQLVSKKLGPDTWIPIQMVSWSIVAASQAALRGRTSLYLTRFLLGFIEGGFIPDTILYLSYFFTNAELPRRLSWFWTSYQSSQIIGAFLAYAILHLRGRGHLHQGWRYIFLIEGVFTRLIGVWTWMYLPASPTQTARGKYKGLLRPLEGWFSRKEEIIMVTRVLLDDPGKATMHNRQGLSRLLFWEALTDYHLWPIYLLGLTWSIPVTPPQAYITLTCKALGFNTFETNRLTIPAYTLFILQLLFWTWASGKNKSAGSHQPHYSVVDFAASHSPRHFTRCLSQQQLVQMGHFHSPCWLSLLPRCPGGSDFAQCRIRANPYSWLVVVQHGGPGGEHFLITDLQRR